MPNLRWRMLATFVPGKMENLYNVRLSDLRWRILASFVPRKMENLYDLESN